MSEELNTSAPKSVGELLPKMELRGTVKRIELYGAFVDIGVGKDALLHISQLGQANVRNVEDVVKSGEEVTVYILKVDAATERVQLSLVKPPDFTWEELSEGTIVSGKVVRVESFGAFVDIGAERPAMIHVKEMADEYVNSAADRVKIGEVVQARIIKVDRKKRQIDMSMKAAEEPIEMPEADEEDAGSIPTAMELALREAMDIKQDARSRRDKRERGDRDKQRRREQEDIIDRTLRNPRQ